MQPAQDKEKASGNLKRNLLFRFSLLLLLFVILIAVSFTFTKLTLDTKKYDSVIINLAGRQRMLIHKYTSEINQVLVGLAVSDWKMALDQNEAATQTADRFERVIKAFTEGGDTFVGFHDNKRIYIPPIESEIVQEHLGHVKTMWDELRRAVVIALRSDVKSIANNKYAVQIRVKTDEAVEEANHVVMQMQYESEAKLYKIEILQIIMVSVGGLLFIGITMFVYWKIITPLAHSMTRIQFNNELLSSEIAERKKMEEELIKVQRLESVGILAGGIAHDFNNYLQGILSNIAIAKSYTDSNDKMYINLTESEKAVLQAKDLTQQLLTFSKGGEPIKKAIFACELIKESANLALSGSNVRCELFLPDCRCLIEVDKGQINQVFSNLFINAAQAMPTGGTVKVIAEHYNVEKNDLLPLQEGRHVKITIKDQGTGISQEDLQKIFDPYFTTKATGSGLGLATVFSIIKKHDGYITAESEIGVGTTFYIYLPASQKEIPEETVAGGADKESIEKITSLDGRKILFMEDDGIIRLSVTSQLKGLKYEVEDAKDGNETIKLYKKAMESDKPFDAVIMDLTIPGGMGGKEAIKELLKIDPDVNAIVASGYSDDQVLTKFGEYGFKGVVEKPYEIYELNEVLQKVMMEKS